MTEYDGIFIGAGHNSLVAAGYLARAGLSILLVERMVELGGGLDSHENPYRPGFWHNVHSQHHRAVSDLGWFKHLQMAEQGIQYVRVPLSVAMMLRDGRAVLWYGQDGEKTAASLAAFSSRDAATFRDVARQFAEAARLIVGPETYNPPVPGALKQELLSKSEAGRTYLAYRARSIRETVNDLFASDEVRAMMAVLSVIRGYELDGRGQGFAIPAAIAGGINSQLCKGTSHKLAHGLHKMVTRAGADLVEGQGVRRIVIEEGRAVGVVLDDGREIRARRFVASSLNPHQTFLDLVGRERLDPDFARRVEGFRYSMTTPLFTAHLALNERPVYVAERHEPAVKDAFYHIMGCDTLDDIEELYRQAHAGTIPTKHILIGGCPSHHDPSQAPPGKALAYMWQIAPGNLFGEPEGSAAWDRVRERYLDEVVAFWRRYAPNLDERNILDKFAMTPVDVQRHLPNMVGGDWMVGEINEQQFQDTRPFPECAQHRTPIAGLYVCGASCHPGGNITGAPGHNAAMVICDDLGIEKWWHPHDVVEMWRQL